MRWSKPGFGEIALSVILGVNFGSSHWRLRELAACSFGEDRSCLSRATGGYNAFTFYLVDLAKAQRQLGVLTGALRQKVGLQLVEIPPDPALPLSWRIEDVAVVQGDTALITTTLERAAAQRG
ncbi:hypothetical protein AAFF_G00362940 [Aldrovandia affinis]|uniref:Uncharacterized protein n=1 Tax=Aldrovandia affinis TaxID=143900 RepID=A0AAD7R7A8_9TELE|nr:hypothetical protein AAFF_G00362940 [Aldrovandia affinis]